MDQRLAPGGVLSVENAHTFSDHHHFIEDFLQLAAFAVDKNQPLAIELTAAGAYADLERLKQEGIADDFATIVASAQAIPQDPQNVDPPLTDHR